MVVPLLPYPPVTACFAHLQQLSVMQQLQYPGVLHKVLRREQQSQEMCVVSRDACGPTTENLLMQLVTHTYTLLR